MFHNLLLKPHLHILMFWLILSLFTACQGTAQEPPPPTPNVEATVQTAVEATAQAQATLEANIDATVQEAVDDTVAEAVDTALNQALEPAMDQIASTLDPTVAAAAGADIEHYATYPEEELTLLIETAIDQATTATEIYASTASTATADDTVTTAEAQAIEVYVQTANTATAAAETLIDAYSIYFGDLAGEALNELSAVEEELDQIEDNVETMNELLGDIEQTLDEGVDLAEETITQIEQAADTATDSLQSLQTQTQAWANEVQVQVESRANAVDSFQPTEIAADLQGSLQQTQQFIGAVQTATSDKVLTLGEFEQIAQLGNNAAASLDANGGAPVQQLSEGIQAVTDKLAHGNLGQAQAELSTLQTKLSEGVFEGIGELDISIPDRSALDSDNFSGLERPTKPDVSRPGRN